MSFCVMPLGPIISFLKSMSPNSGPEGMNTFLDSLGAFEATESAASTAEDVELALGVEEALLPPPPTAIAAASAAMAFEEPPPAPSAPEAG